MPIDEVSFASSQLRSLILSDGRQLTWQEYGEPEGNPALYFHGGGSCSLEGAIFHAEAVQRNIRLIATNRPGAYGSSVCRRRPVVAYADDIAELLGHLGVERFACFGESNGGMVTLAIASAMARWVVGAVPINPTVPWFDRQARMVTSGSAGTGYRLMKYAPRLLVWAAQMFAAKPYKPKQDADGFRRSDLYGPPPGTEPGVAAIHDEMLARAGKGALIEELRWASANWGFDFYSIGTRLDLHCGAFDAQSPFALVLAERNPDAAFHYHSYGHQGFFHPDTRRRIVDLIKGYFEA